MATWPHVEDFSWTRRKPLKYRVGDEKLETLVIYSSTVALNDTARRLIPAATLLCKITSGLGIGKYGPYEPTASDGRQTIGTTDQVYVALAGHDVTLGDLSCEGLWMDCVFNTSEILKVNAISASDLSTLKTAFPQSHFG